MTSILAHTCIVCSVSLMFVPSCEVPDTDVVFYVHAGYTFSRAEQRTIRILAQSTADEAKRLLPDLPLRLVVRVNPGKHVIEAIGVGISPIPPNILYWTVDPRRGVIATAEAHLRPTLLYGLHRLARVQHVSPKTLMDHVVDAGMATAFQRDFGGQRYPWHEHPARAAEWADKLFALPPTAEPNDWMVRHEWIGIRTGLYLVDKAMTATGRNSAELVTVSTGEIARLALEQAAKESR